MTHNNQSLKTSLLVSRINYLHFKNSSLVLPIHSKTEDKLLCQLGARDSGTGAVLRGLRELCSNSRHWWAMGA